MKLFGVSLFQKKTQELYDAYNSLTKIKQQIDNAVRQNEALLKELKQRENALKKLVTEQSKGNPYLATVISRYYRYRDEQSISYLKNKDRPAHKAADVVDQISSKNKNLIFENELLKNYIGIYETLFPFIKEIQDIQLDTLLNDQTLATTYSESLKEKFLSINLENKTRELKDFEQKRKSEIEQELTRFAIQKKNEVILKSEQIDEELSKRKTEIENKESRLVEKINRLKETLKNAFENLKKEQSIGNEHLVKTITDFYFKEDLKIAEMLENKNPPALKGSEEVRQISREKKKLNQKYNITRNYIKLYEYLFPYITDFQSEDLDFLLQEKEKGIDFEADEKDDPVKKYVPEYNSLSEEEINQRALDRYIKSPNKSTWEIGRLYERYIGYLYEQQGYDVEYVGALKGFEDFGRDLICRKETESIVVQCKYWAQGKTIREAHINQLFGTTVKLFLDVFTKIRKEDRNSLFPDYFLTPSDLNIKAVFASTVEYSEEAKNFAEALGVELKKIPMSYNYPMIKCNLEEKIYHLPFDQQYDRIKMGIHSRQYAKTVKAAIELGCSRRAWRWNPFK